MSYDLHYYENWLGHNGKTVLINGIKHKLEVRTHRAIYPRRYIAVTVYAAPINRNTKYYRDTKAKLGDDWSTDVLYNPELAADILEQLK
jgi:hypothetical protein